MDDMTRSASVSVVGSEFDDFLFATIGEDRNGTPLSVLSALARRDVDPWQEAAELARLPGKTSTRRLASLIAALPDGSSARLDTGTIAARLIALLPRGASSNVPSRQTLSGVGAVANPRAVIYVIFYAIFIASMMGIVASRQPSAQVDNAPAPTSSAVSPEKPPPSSGK